MINLKTPARFAFVLTLLATVGFQGAASAEPISGGPVDGVVGAPPPPATPTPSDFAAPYSLPWQLRPVAAGNVVRLDSAAAIFDDANGNLDEAVITTLTASYQITRDWAPMVRLGFVGNDAPGAALDGTSFVNPLVGATYARTMGSYRLALFGATTIPVGTGGGDAPDGGAARTNVASSQARPADSAMFAVNYLTEIVGVDLAYVNHGFTAQAEATLLQSVRVRGDRSAAATDRFRTGSAVGVHLGYFIGSHFSLGADLRYQRWLSHPTTRSAPTGGLVPYSEGDMDVVTVARACTSGWASKPGFARGSPWCVAWMPADSTRL